MSVRREDLEQDFMNLLDAVEPNPEYLRLFKAIVLDVCRQKAEEVETISRAAERRVRELETKKRALVDAFVYRHAVAEDVYRSEDRRLDEEITVARIEANDARWEQFDVASVLEFAEYVLSHASQLWQEFNLDQMQRLQRVMFQKVRNDRSREILWKRSFSTSGPGWRLPPCGTRGVRWPGRRQWCWKDDAALLPGWAPQARPPEPTPR